MWGRNKEKKQLLFHGETGMEEQGGENCKVRKLRRGRNKGRTSKREGWNKGHGKNW